MSQTELYLRLTELRQTIGNHLEEIAREQANQRVENNTEENDSLESTANQGNQEKNPESQKNQKCQEKRKNQENQEDQKSQENQNNHVNKGIEEIEESLSNGETGIFLIYFQSFFINCLKVLI